MIIMAKSPSRCDVLKSLAASHDARTRAKQQLTDTKEYLQPQAFMNRWKTKQDALLKQVSEQGHEVVRKNAPVIAIMAVSGLLFAGRLITERNIAKSKRDPSAPDI